MKIFNLIGLLAVFLMGCASQNISLAQNSHGDLVNVSFVHANRSDTLGFSYELYRLSGERLHYDDVDNYSQGGAGFASYYAGGVFPRPGNKIRIRWKVYSIKASLAEIDKMSWREKVLLVEGDENSLTWAKVATVMCSPDEVHVRVFGYDEKKLETADSSNVRSDTRPFRTLCKDGKDKE
ncbi:hypothetical protein [Chromobacterium subtsugae]|uniref:hypothetical protein n=1 Tax=Chromobacterium subtsugae TaxID=251747 RepID=UPI0012D47BFB|nr:hypothetical protein [Chromobacterium subtsugae]